MLTDIKWGHVHENALHIEFDCSSSLPQKYLLEHTQEMRSPLKEVLNLGVGIENILL